MLQPKYKNLVKEMRELRIRLSNHNCQSHRGSWLNCSYCLQEHLDERMQSKEDIDREIKLLQQRVELLSGWKSKDDALVAWTQTIRYGSSGSPHVRYCIVLEDGEWVIYSLECNWSTHTVEVMKWRNHVDSEVVWSS